MILKYSSLCFHAFQHFLTFPLVGRNIYFACRKIRVVMTGSLRDRKGYFSELFHLKADQRVYAERPAAGQQQEACWRPGGSSEEHTCLLLSLVLLCRGWAGPPVTCSHTAPQMVPHDMRYCPAHLNCHPVDSSFVDSPTILLKLATWPSEGDGGEGKVPP